MVLVQGLYEVAVKWCPELGEQGGKTAGSGRAFIALHVTSEFLQVWASWTPSQHGGSRAVQENSREPRGSYFPFIVLLLEVP